MQYSTNRTGCAFVIVRTFLISHRIATIRKSDLILVLDKGRVVQMGTHDTLAAQEGLYRRVCAIQNELPQAASPKGGEA